MEEEGVDEEEAVEEEEVGGGRGDGVGPLSNSSAGPGLGVLGGPVYLNTEGLTIS